LGFTNLKLSFSLTARKGEAKEQEEKRGSQAAVAARGFETLTLT